MGRDNKRDKNGKNGILENLPDKKLKIKKGDVCKFSNICPFQVDCLGAMKNSTIRRDIFICDLKILKEKYNNLIVV